MMTNTREISWLEWGASRIQYSPFRKSITYNSYTILNRFPQAYAFVDPRPRYLPSLYSPGDAGGGSNFVRVCASPPLLWWAGWYQAGHLLPPRPRQWTKTFVVDYTRHSANWGCIHLLGGGGNNYQEDGAVEDHLALDMMPPIYTTEKDISQRVLPIAPNQILGFGLCVHSMCLLHEFLSAFYSISLYLIHNDIWNKNRISPHL